MAVDSGTYAEYNGIPFSFVHTREMNSEVESDKLSGKDMLYVRRTIRLGATFAFVPGNPVPPSRPGETPTQTMARVRMELAVPRRPFKLVVAGDTLVQSNGLDPAGGPTPVGEPKIVRLAPMAYDVEWTVVVCDNACAEVSNPPIWSSLRWTQEQTTDETGYSTFVTSGQAIFNAHMIGGLKSVDDLRWITVPPELPNCIRHTKHALAADGLSLLFTYTDTEQYVMPPADARKITGQFVHRFARGGGKWFAFVSLALEGMKNVPKPRLMATAMSIAYNRLKKAGIKGDDKTSSPMVMEGSFTESFDKNGVKVELGAITVPPDEVKKADEKSDFWFGFGEGFAGGILGAVVPGAGLLALVGNGTPVDTYLGDDNDPTAIQQVNDQAKKVDKAPTGWQAMNLQQWGSPLLGCNMPEDPPAAGLAPPLYGNFPAWRMFAAAFKDPCLDAQIGKLERQQWEKLAASPGTPPPLTPSLLSRPQAQPVGTNTTVILNGLPPVQNVSLKTLVDPYPGIWMEYYVDAEWDRTENTDVLPATVAGLPGKQVSWANPELVLIVTWTGTKGGGPVTVPDLTPKDTNAVLLNSGEIDHAPERAPDGLNRIYSATGWARYKFLDTTQVNKQYPRIPFLPAGTLPPSPIDRDVIFPDDKRDTKLRSQQR
jgi:hypothetical protein